MEPTAPATASSPWSNVLDAGKSMFDKALSGIKPAATPSVAAAPAVPGEAPGFADAFWTPGGNYTNTPEYKGQKDPEAYLRQQFEEGVPSQLNSLDEAKQALSRSFRHTFTPGVGDVAKARLAAYPQQLKDLYDKEGYTPEQRKSFMEEAAKTGLTPGGFDKYRDQIQKMVGDQINREEADFETSMKAVQTTDMNIGDFGNFLTSNWANMVTPIGVLMTLFGGSKFTKILGIMGAGFGAKNLYDRYKVMSDPSNPANSFFTTALKQATMPEKPGTAPFSNMEGVRDNVYSLALAKESDPLKAQALTDKAIQGVQDFQLLSKIGFGNYMLGRGHEMAQTAREVYDFSRPAPAPQAAQ
jgi:hypothetical protein